MRLRYSRPAARDLERILSYISEHSPQGARRVQLRIRAVIDLLIEHPFAGHPTRREGTRRIVVTPYPYLVFYRLTADEIIIRAIRHAARDPASMPDAGEP